MIVSHEQERSNLVGKYKDLIQMLISPSIIVAPERERNEVGGD